MDFMNPERSSRRDDLVSVAHALNLVASIIEHSVKAEESKKTGREPLEQLVEHLELLSKQAERAARIERLRR